MAETQSGQHGGESDDPLPDTQEQSVVAFLQVAGTTKTATHLANKRTFVAWCCIGVLLVVSGVLIAHISHTLNTSPLIIFRSNPIHPQIKSTTVGLFFLVGGVVIIFLACFRFLQVQKQIEEDAYRASNFLALAFLFLILLLTAVLVLNLLELGSYVAQAPLICHWGNLAQATCSDK